MDLLTRLEDCLARGIETGDRLLENLRAENAALAASEPERLEQALLAKAETLAAFEAVDRERDRLMREAGIDPDRGDIEAGLAHNDPAQRTSVVQHWRRLRDLAGRCREQNAINGALVQSGLRHMQEVMAVLRGQSPAERPAAYGPPGEEPRPSAPASRHTLGKA